MVRSQFNVPADYDVALGARTPSKIPGYDSIRITFTHPPHTSTSDFLISADNKSLARFETFDLTRIRHKTSRSTIVRSVATRTRR